MAGIDLTQAVLLTVCGFFILRGANWARLAFYALCVANLIDIFTLRAKGDLDVEIGVALFRIIIIGSLLLTKRANRFFAGLDPHRGGTPPNSDHASRIAQQPRGEIRLLAIGASLSPTHLRLPITASAKTKMSLSKTSIFNSLPLLVLLILSGCASQQQPPASPPKKYKLETIVRDGTPPTYLLRPIDDPSPAR